MAEEKMLMGYGKKDSQPNVLVVDDTRDNLRLLSNILSEQGYHVRPVSQGRGQFRPRNPKCRT